MNIDKNKLTKAIKFALKDYDKETILEIVTNEIGGWTGDAEPLNHVSPIELRRILFVEM